MDNLKDKIIFNIKPKPGMKDLKTDPSLWNIPLTYAKKEVNELEKKVLTAKKLWA